MPFEATYDAANRMTAITINAGGTAKSYTLAHDAKGNLISKQNTAHSSDKTSYSWDSNNRLIGIEQPGLQASFTYDAYGRRIQSSITQAGQTSTVQNLYEGQQALGEICEKSLSHRLLTGLSLDETIARMALDPSGNLNRQQSRMFMTDALNSVIAQLNDDEQASLANSYAYSPYGQSEVIGIDSAGNPIQYTSRENDGAGLIYYRNRYRDPIRGWTSDDPSGFSGGLNARGIIEGDPINLMDPLGLWAIGDPLPQPLVDFSAGFGDVMSLGATDWLRDRAGWNDSIDRCSGAYMRGDMTGMGIGLAMGGAGLAKAGFRAEFGAWKQGGRWFAGGRKMPHFHLGTGPGMSMHHLPYQAGNWGRNFSANLSRGKAGRDLRNMAAVAYGFAAAAKGAMNDCTCKR